VTMTEYVMEEPDQYGVVAWFGGSITLGRVTITGARQAGLWFYDDTEGTLTDTAITDSGSEGVRIHAVDVRMVGGALLRNGRGGARIDVVQRLQRRGLRGRQRRQHPLRHAGVVRQLRRLQ